MIDGSDDGTGGTDTGGAGGSDGSGVGALGARARRFLRRAALLVAGMGGVDALILAFRPALRTPEAATNVTDLTAAAVALVGLLNIVGARGSRVGVIAENARLGRATHPAQVRDSFAKEDRAFAFLALCGCAAACYFFLARACLSLAFN